MAVVYHDLRALQFALGWKPEGAAVVIEHGSMGLGATSSIQALNLVIFAAHRLWLAGRESYGRSLYLLMDEPFFIDCFACNEDACAINKIV